MELKNDDISELSIVCSYSFLAFFQRSAKISTLNYLIISGYGIIVMRGYFLQNYIINVEYGITI